MPDYGIDVSGFNAVTNWAAVRAAGNTWVWSKATQGGSYANPLFASQFAGSRAAGLATGAYHFPDPNVSVAANVNHFVGVASAVGAFAAGAFVPMLDVENDTADGIVWTASAANAFIPAFRDELRAATGQRKLCVYAPQSWWANGMLRPDDWADGDVFLCAARYGFSAGNVGWSHPRLAVHQYTDAAATPGVTKPTDRSVTVGGFTAAALTVGATQRGGGNMAVFLKNMDVPGAYATQDGPLVSGIRESVGQATLAAWPGASCEIGLNNQEFTDRVNKSKALEGLAAAIAGLPAAIAAALPVGGTGGLTADQLAAAVATGVRAGLDGITESVVLHKPAGS